MQVWQYAMLLFSVASKDTTLCFVRLLERMDINGEDVINEYECPLFMLTPHIVAIPSSNVQTYVSFIYQCSSSCTFVQSTMGRTVEHETINTRHLTYKHDWTNTLYCLNVYCTNQWPLQNLLCASPLGIHCKFFWRNYSNTYWYRYGINKSSTIEIIPVWIWNYITDTLWIWYGATGKQKCGRHEIQNDFEP